MRASSDSIAKLAGSLAKAQGELTNPPRTLTARLEPTGKSRAAQTYRYASLSAGLDVVRKTLGKHDLVVIQTTEVDQASALVILTTTLAHVSGEWVAAHWPVCRVGDLCHPKLMGAALTYARRYGLFMIVGLAAEDDLDGPDLGGLDPAQGREDHSGQKPEGAAPLPMAEAVPLGSDIGRSKGLTYNLRRSLELIASSGAGRGSAGMTEPSPTLASLKPSRGDAGEPPAATNGGGGTEQDPSGTSLTQLERIEDAEGLLRWALKILPARNDLDDPTRAALDNAFLARAGVLEGDPDLTLAFEPSPRSTKAKSRGLRSRGHKP